MDDVVRQLLAQRPFLPFRISMTSRTVYLVEEPDLAVVRNGVVDIYRRKPGSPNGRELAATLSSDHIVSITEEDDGPVVVTG
jgi:hypothetical protein